MGDFEDIVGNSMELSELSTAMAVSVEEEIGSSEVSISLILLVIVFANEKFVTMDL